MKRIILIQYVLYKSCKSNQIEEFILLYNLLSLDNA